MIAIKEAHTQSVHAEIIPIEITAAAFDPGYQRLITGAHDGSLKIWNFNTGTCLRNMKLEKKSEVKCIIWVNNRILAMGWNRRVTEFGDSGDVLGSGGQFYKNWDLRHKEDISAAAVRIPQTIVTSTYDGEIIMWRLETGQPYKQYNVADPTTRIKIMYKKMRQKEDKEHSKFSKKNIIARALGKHIKEDKLTVPKRAQQPTSDEAPPPEVIKQSTARRASVAQRMSVAPMSRGSTTPGGGVRQRRVSTVLMPEQCMPLRRLAVHSMLFLNNRTMDPAIGTLLIALENGAVQVWSHHISGGFITSFSAIHKAGDYVICMTSDLDNEFLFTGSCAGYIKTWLIKDYCVPNPERINMPRLRIMFPFLWGDFFIGRAKRMSLGQPKPMLMNSYKGHVMPVSGLAYIDEAKIIIRYVFLRF